MLQRLTQQALVGVVRPYVAAELPGWGRVYKTLVGTYERNDFWSNAPTVRSRNKFFGYETDWDLRRWSDRQNFFLGRWYDLGTQLLTYAVGGTTIIDVGANRGDFALAAAAMFPDAKVIAFEPIPDMASIVRHNLATNGITNVEVRECALGERNEALQLHVPFKGTGGSSFGGFAAPGFVMKDIPVRRGDDELAGLNPDFIKIDVEGFELHTLRGLQKTLAEARPVVETEHVEETLALCGTTTAMIERFMVDMGYRGFSVDVKRKGLDYELALGKIGATPDVAWVPQEVDPESLHASTKDLRHSRRRADARE